MNLLRWLRCRQSRASTFFTAVHENRNPKSSSNQLRSRQKYGADCTRTERRLVRPQDDVRDLPKQAIGRLRQEPHLTHQIRLDPMDAGQFERRPEARRARRGVSSGIVATRSGWSLSYSGRAVCDLDWVRKGAWPATDECLLLARFRPADRRRLENMAGLI